MKNNIWYFVQQHYDTYIQTALATSLQKAFYYYELYKLEGGKKRIARLEEIQQEDTRRFFN